MTPLTTDRGEVKVVPLPAGTRGYALDARQADGTAPSVEEMGATNGDLRRAAKREALGSGVSPPVASVGDLARMLADLGREEDEPRLRTLRQLAEVELGRGLEV